MFLRISLTLMMLISGVLVLLLSGTRRNWIFIVVGIALYVGALAYMGLQAWRVSKRKRKINALYNQDEQSPDDEGDDKPCDDPPKVNF
ncbi:hypothetical protein G4Y79_19870 [Phototrophicus methaneseepsis]|uniref:Uncharacterized protein n=1 Tax=Phototrophicus methaneseepsis TaxID=2710758 RepID=A0A7S8E7S1_9CHLR|nr:hypothetical protein [Phototrophicus methaneseepsis]QPC81922.1 hypothetical protein G4Y79_19870 [Phototrophicus methaneseepsis]